MRRAYSPLRYLGTTQTVSYTGTAGRTTNALGAQTRVVRIVLTTTGFVAFGSVTFDATITNGMHMVANREEYFSVNAGQYVSAIQLSSGGNMYVSEMG